MAMKNIQMMRPICSTSFSENQVPLADQWSACHTGILQGRLNRHCIAESV
jgi:hypothetical protein